MELAAAAGALYRAPSGRHLVHLPVLHVVQVRDRDHAHRRPQRLRAGFPGTGLRTQGGQRVSIFSVILDDYI